MCSGSEDCSGNGVRREEKADSIRECLKGEGRSIGSVEEFDISFGNGKRLLYRNRFGIAKDSESMPVGK